MLKKTTYLYTLLAAILFSLTACSTIPTTKPEPPTVKLLSVKPVKLGLKSQELAFELEVTNPNAYPLPLQALSFIAALEDEEVARGFTGDRVTLPANGNAVIEISVNTSISKVFGQLLSLANSARESVDYDVSGFVKLANWPLRIPFGVDGNLSQ